MHTVAAIKYPSILSVSVAVIQLEAMKPDNEVTSFVWIKRYEYATNLIFFYIQPMYIERSCGILNMIMK